MSNQVPRLDDSKAERIVRELLDRIMKLEKSKSGETGNPSQTTGKPGDVRVVRQADGTQTLQVRSEEGWQVVTVTFKDKEE